MAAVIALPQALKLQQDVLPPLFADYVFNDRALPSAIRVQSVAAIGPMATTDTNAERNRDHSAAMRREEGGSIVCWSRLTVNFALKDLYNAFTRRRIDAALLRDRRGATCAQYQLCIISDCLSTAYNTDRQSRLILWETTLKLCLRAPEESLTNMLPDVLGDIVDELKRSFESETIRQHRCRVIQLLGQAILLRPGSDYEEQWPRAVALVARSLEEASTSQDEITAILFVALSIISKARSSVAKVASALLPILLRCVRHANSESSTIVFGIKLLAVFTACMSPHTSAVIAAVEELSRTHHFENIDVVETCLRLLVALSEHVHLYGHAIPMENLLSRAPLNDRLIPLVQKVRGNSFRASLRLTRLVSFDQTYRTSSPTQHHLSIPTFQIFVRIKIVNSLIFQTRYLK